MENIEDTKPIKDSKEVKTKEVETPKVKKVEAPVKKIVAEKPPAPKTEVKKEKASVSGKGSKSVIRYVK